MIINDKGDNENRPREGAFVLRTTSQWETVCKEWEGNVEWEYRLYLKSS